jgi:hypothetical protein
LATHEETIRVHADRKRRIIERVRRRSLNLPHTGESERLGLAHANFAEIEEGVVAGLKQHWTA